MSSAPIMNLLKRLIDLWAGATDITVGVPSPNQVPPPAKAPKTNEPSCLARGIAKAWVEDRANWVVERTKSNVLDVWYVALTHAPLGISITFRELFNFVVLCDLEVRVGGVLEVPDHPMDHLCPRTGYEDTSDRDFVRAAIYQHPYHGLKERVDAAAREDAARVKNIKAIEELGCAT